MSDRFSPITMEQLTAWIFEELDSSGAIFGIPERLFFRPEATQPYRLDVYGRDLDTPFGVAAGPHSQLAQNIIVAWLCGARFMELKTVQTLDELEVPKPCIDMEDEGYNVEWSQELKVRESYDEYLRAWVLIHALQHRLGLAGEPGVIFNLSVGYNLEGISKPNVQWFLDKCRDTSAEKAGHVEIVARYYPAVRALRIPDQMSDNITLSTMHGCPPDEIESISRYLLVEKGFHTSVKLNPTLLGPARVREILNDELGFEDITVPDEAFGHDLKYADAVPMLRRLLEVARAEGLTFGVKLSNTLEVENHRPNFAGEAMMYLSGRPLQAITVNLAATLAREFGGTLLMSYAGGADAFNVSALLAAGMKTITVCSDLLKSGGYLRLLQYVSNLSAAMERAGAGSLAEWSVAHAAAHPAALAEALVDVGLPADRRDTVVALAATDPARALLAGPEPERVRTAAARANLTTYAAHTVLEPDLKKGRFKTWASKTSRSLGAFDCIQAPCTDNCKTHQDVPAYMRAVRDGRMTDAVAVVREDNPLGAVLSRICDRKCEDTCVRTHFDDPLAIREIKRFIMDHEAAQTIPAALGAAKATRAKVAIVGAGPCGLAAARELVTAGYPCTVFEMHQKPGGMVSGTIPTYRLPQSVIDQDVRLLEAMGVEFRYGMTAGRDFKLSDLKAQGFEYTVLGVGAQAGKTLALDGIESEGVMDAIIFLRAVRDGDAGALDPASLGQRIAVVGAGDVAMDAARTCFRLTDAEVMVIYRRTIAQMPADPEEIRGLLEEGITVCELRSPKAIETEGGRLKALVCQKMTLSERGADGRRRPVPLDGEEERFEIDTLLLAVSQRPVLDFFDAVAPALTAWGTVAVDATTLETSLGGVFSGGDAAADGPSSAVAAVGDGRRIAAEIRRREEGRSDATGPALVAGDLQQMVIDRFERQFRVAIPHRDTADRKHFEEIVSTLDAEAAKAEAERCVSCDQLCSLCVSVCPNLAIMTWLASRTALRVPTLALRAGALSVVSDQAFEVDQEPQVAIQTDFCNECGNCVTFCPTSGRPYVDKPRLYLNPVEFEGEADNAFMRITAETPTLWGRVGGETHRLERGEQVIYTTPKVRVVLNPADFSVVAATVTDGVELDDGAEVSLLPAATLLTLLDGLEQSMPWLPRCRPSEG